MPRTGTILQALVASPADVAEERQYLEEATRELNLTWSKNLGVYIELVKWETHSYPGIGIDSQAVINEQFADDYDIFIGIMWARFGTPTGRAGSGTADEFDRALERYKKNPSSIRIMFYFKDAPISPSNLDPEQLALLKKFKQELGEKGTYYWEYKSLEEFGPLIRMHLSHQVQEWGKTWGIESKAIIAKEQTETQLPSNMAGGGIENEEQEEGFLDLLEEGQERLEGLTEVLARITSALGVLTNKLNERTEEMKQSDVASNTFDIKQRKRISNRAAEDMNNFAALLEVEVPAFSNSLSGGMEAYTRAFTLLEGSDLGSKEEVESSLNTTKEFRVVLQGNRDAMLGFREIVASIPRATIMLNRAKRRVLSVLDKLGEEISAALNLTSEIEKVFERFLEK
jgi:hypothetical protein